MYVQRKPVKDLPKDAIILTEPEVLQYYDDFIFGTKFTNEIWALKYGSFSLGAAAFATNYFIVNNYRKRCRLHGFGPILFMNLFLVSLPSAFALAAHFHDCRTKILLHNLCTPCLYGKAVVYQNGFSVGYGLVPSALMCMLIAVQRQSYPIPGFASLQEAKDSFAIWKKFTKRIVPITVLLLIANTVFTIYITKSELEGKENLDKILQKQHKKLKEVAEEYEQQA